MSLKSFIGRFVAKHDVAQTKRWSNSPIKTQEKVLRSLLDKAKNTDFGKDHGFLDIQNYDDFKKAVPVRDYEGLKHYIEKIREGKLDVLWKGKPLYFAKTSGTTSGAKFIPLTKESLSYQIKAAKSALLHYVVNSGNHHFISGKMIFLQGSPELDKRPVIPNGRLSGIVANFIPRYLQANRLPSYKTNCIEDWEQKVEAIIEETLPQDMRLISGIPSWVQMYFEKLEKKTGKKISALFPNFSLFVFGGVNYEPYRKKFEELIGKKIDSLELYPASEGFFAFQDRQNEPGMLLQLDSGMFYEFIVADTFFEASPTRLTLKDVKIGVNYVIIISTNAGLWAYNIGYTVQFTSLAPFRVIVSGRIKHFISAFGEHVIAKEVEHALLSALKTTEVSVSEFTVAPQIEPLEGLPYHEWFIEFENSPSNIEDFATQIDAALQSQNSYYLDLIQGKVLQPLKITPVQKGGFQNYMKTIGKLGGQNKTPRLSNDRKIADVLTQNIQVK